jgi:hypothetical protein
VLRHGHEAAVEQVVARHERFVVVAKQGSAGEFAEFSDPR